MEQDAWKEMIADIESGKEVRVDEETAYYFLEVLPPVHMNYVAKFDDGTERKVWFGFAEGYEHVKACWPHPEEKGIYLIRKTTEINPYR